jgi:hypothetical protein
MGVMIVDAPATGVPVVVISHHHPVVRGPVPPPVTLCHRPGESPHASIRMGLFLCRDVSLCLLTGIGLRLPCRFNL